MKFKLDKKVYQKRLRSTKVKDKIKFHNYLVELLDVQPEDKVLDLGCGYGQTLIYITQKLGKKGIVIGVDIGEAELAVAELLLDSEVKSGKLELIKADVSKTLPFQKGYFDKIICQNVIECIPDKIKFINSCFSFLKKGGVLIISHCDFDTKIYNSSIPEVSRRLIHNYTDTTQEWMATSDGMIGRKLNGMIKKTKFTNFESKIYVMENNRYASTEYGYRMSHDIIDIAKESGKFKSSEIKDWINVLKEKDKNSEYFYSMNINLVIAKK